MSPCLSDDGAIQAPMLRPATFGFHCFHSMILHTTVQRIALIIATAKQRRIVVFSAGPGFALEEVLKNVTGAFEDTSQESPQRPPSCIRHVPR